MAITTNYASNAKANGALTTGIIGTAGVGLGLLNQLMNGGGRFAPPPPTEQLATREYVDLKSENDSLKSTLALTEKVGDQAVINATQKAQIEALNNQIFQLQGTLNNLTRVVIPYENVMPDPNAVTRASTTSG